MPSTTEAGTDPTEQLDFRAELVWDIPENTSCPMVTKLSENPNDITIYHDKGTCYMEVDLVDSIDGCNSDKLRLEQEVGNCSCPSFRRNGCYPRFKRVEDMKAVAEVFLSNKKTLRNLVLDLRQSGRNASIRSLTISGKKKDIAEIRAINVATLTEREKDCIEFAVQEGYYDKDRKITLQDIAEEFDVNKSTCSERLGSAEAKIVKNLFDE